jgi:hypothetical protein
MKEYRLSRGIRVLLYIITLLLLIGSAWGSVALFRKAQSTGNGMFYALMLFPIGLMVLAVLVFLDACKTRYVIGPAGIKRYSLDSRELLMHEIAGYRTGGKDKRIILIPKERHLKKIQISTYLEHYSEIKKWVDTHFKDLDLEEANIEQEQVLNNTIYGLTSDERIQRLNSAKQAAGIINNVSVIVALWFIVFPKPYLLVFWVAFLMPLIAIGAVLKYGGMINLVTKKNSSLPNVFVAFFVALVLFLRAVLDFEILDYGPLWIRSGALTGILILTFALLVMMLQRNMTHKTKVILSSVLFLAPWGYGTVVITNCVYDYTQPKVYTARVLDKRVDKYRKSTSYYLKITSWGMRKEAEETTIDKQTYNETNVGDAVHIYAKHGRFNVPWYWIEK